MFFLIVVIGGDPLAKPQAPDRNSEDHPMQPIPSSTTGITILTTAHFHQGQLQDYELLLSKLREKVGSLADFSQRLIEPCTCSPLDQENDTGQDAIKQLIEDPDYRRLCQDKKVSPYNLIVTLRDGTFIYETSNHGGADKIELAVTEYVKCQALLTRIENSVDLLGGQIRYDGLLSVPRFAAFYGMTPWNPMEPAEHQAAIRILEEKIASYQLGLEEDFNLLDLKRDLTKNDKQAIYQDSPSARDELLGDFIAAEVKTAIRRFLPDGIASPLTYLANDVLRDATPEQVRNQPTLFLQKILQGSEAQKLCNLLLQTMDWYGGKPGEETSPYIRIKVVASALRMWFKAQFIEYPDRIAGYDLQSCSNWGKSYQKIREEFESHLLTSKKASSEKEAIVMARLFICEFPTEFRITDIPADLPYRTSLVWVNFVNGVNFLSSTAPEALNRQNFQKLVDLPLKLSMSAAKDQLYRVSLARLIPTVDWAITQNLIPHKDYDKYTISEIERAVSELDKYTNNLNDALIKLNKPSPDRLSIAKSNVEQYFQIINLDNPSSTSFWNDHKLGIVPAGGLLNPERYVIEKYSLIDVVAEDKLEQPWSIFLNDGRLTEHSISLDKRRSIRVGGSLSAVNCHPVPSAKTQFEKRFKNHINSLTDAYQKLITSLLISLPFSERQALEFGTLSVYTLRKETYRVEARHETPEIILPRRARNGLLLLATYKGVTHTFELLPRAGIIRRIKNLERDQFGGILKYENWPIGQNSNSVEVLRNQTLPFDWVAHSTGSEPQNKASCEAIIEQLGHSFMAPTIPQKNTDNTALTLYSNRCREISSFIATQLLFVDPEALRKSAYGTTKFDSDEAAQKRLESVIKFFIPFWSSIEDITSDDLERKVNGAFGLSMDMAAFGLPIGRFASGSAKLLRNAGRLTVRSRLTQFATLTKEVTVLALQSLNPLDLVGILLERGVKLVRLGIFKVKTMAGLAGHHNFIKSMPQIENAGHWRPRVIGDKLATVRGIDDIQVRNLSSAGHFDYRLVDPRSSRPYGPSLSLAPEVLSLGRSHYIPVERTSTHVVIHAAEKNHVREILEVDGRTTLLIDDVPYQLDGDLLRRADLIDQKNLYRILPCRVKRTFGEICRTIYANGSPAPTLPVGTIDEIKGWAPWFGDTIYTPAFASQPLQVRAIERYRQLDATLEFQKGIYARIKIRLPYPNPKHFDTLEVGAIINPAKDESKHYVYTRLYGGNFYFAERTPGQPLSVPLVLRKGQDLPEGLEAELKTVYTGSLNSNNAVRIYGVESVERALKTMEDIAIPLGTPANPPDGLRWLKVDTSPGEALMFDHSTRMIVVRHPEGARSWTRSNEAPEELRRRTAEIFDTLFLSPTISLPGPGSALRIDNSMEKLKHLLRKFDSDAKTRNIAYAEVITANDVREIYVSVSGARGLTKHLPVFHHLGASHVRIGNTTYINIDYNLKVRGTNLELTDSGNLVAVPRTIDNIESYTPSQATRPTSLDSESKLIRVIRDKYPDLSELKSVSVATTMPPCGSCGVVMKAFAHKGEAGALEVLWK